MPARAFGRAAALLGILVAAPAGALAAQAAIFAAPDSPLALTLHADFASLLRRHDDTTTWWPATLGWTENAGSRTVPVELRQRGHFRRLRCDMTPLRLRFAGDSVRGTPWAHLRRPKLVTHCRNTDEYEQYVLSEYALYRLWNLLSPAGFQVRLVRVTYQDATGAVRTIRWAMLVEDPARLAERLGGTLLGVKTVRMSNLRGEDAARLAVFQYLIGNADWSVSGLHNIALVRTPDTVVAVPFDFDWTGAVDARYAYADPRLGVRTVRDRVWRGLCQDTSELAPALARLGALRDSIVLLYRDLPGMQRGTADRALRYFDEFFEEIRDPAWFVRERVRPRCRAA